MAPSKITHSEKHVNNHGIRRRPMKMGLLHQQCQLTTVHQLVPSWRPHSQDHKTTLRCTLAPLLPSLQSNLWTSTKSARFVWHFIELFCPWCSLQEPLSHRPFHHQYPRNRQHHASCNQSYTATTSLFTVGDDWRGRGVGCCMYEYYLHRYVMAAQQ